MLSLEDEGTPFIKVRSDEFEKKLSGAIKVMKENGAYTPSTIVIMEAAFELLQSGLLNIPDVGSLNVKQARAFLWNAVWLQHYMNELWQADDKLPSDTWDSTAHKFHNYALAIVGPGGTGQGPCRHPSAVVADLVA